MRSKSRIGKRRNPLITRRWRSVYRLRLPGAAEPMDVLRMPLMLAPKAQPVQTVGLAFF